MKAKGITVLFSIVLIFSLFFSVFSTVPVMAKDKAPVISVDGRIAIENPGSVVSDGKYIYYAYQGDGKRMDIIKLNPKTLKSKSIAKKTGNGYTNLSIKGNYIYAVLDKVFGYGTGYEEPYIYRISKDGKTKTKLAVGKEPVIIGDKIYYFSGKIYTVKEGNLNFKDFKSDGYISSMDLNGKNKKKVFGVSVEYNGLLKLFKSGERFYYTTDNKTVYDMRGNVVKSRKFINAGEIRLDTFSLDSSYNVKTKLLYRKAGKYGEGEIQVGTYKDKKWKYKKILTNSVTINFSVQGDYMMVKEIVNVTSEKSLIKVYLLDKSGKILKELHSWTPAE